ncbi:MAG: hypothetical protein ICV55_16460 [Coleofasciculus sp. C3-bin4]|nr:hypothetical protein [Coleofasciculus sp. C3-bin4]
MSDKTYELEQRADRIADAIAKLSCQIQQIESQGEVAPAGCCVLRYQARGRRGTYWYYKLHAQEAIFLTQSGKMSKYKHLGKAGSAAHIEAVLQVARRTQIEGLQRMLTALTQCWSDLYDTFESQGQRTSK